MNFKPSKHREPIADCPQPEPEPRVAGNLAAYLAEDDVDSSYASPVTDPLESHVVFGALCVLVCCIVAMRALGWLA